MFEESLIESTGVIAQRKRWPIVSSIGIQAVVAAAIVCVPLLHPEVMKLKPPLLTLVAPRMNKPPEPPPPTRVRVASASESAMTAPAPAPATPINSGPVLTRPTADPSMEPPTGGPINIGASSGPSGLFPGPATGTSPVRVVPAPAAHIGPMNVSSGVIAGLLINPIRPIYPAIAKSAHVEGTVVVQAIISKQGRIESAHVISGSAMLAGAALAAVEAARYNPYLLNNQPTEVETTITITFRLNG